MRCLCITLYHRELWCSASMGRVTLHGLWRSPPPWRILNNITIYCTSNFITTSDDCSTNSHRSSAAAAASIQAGTAVVKLRYHYYSFSPTPSSLPPPHPPLPLPNSDKSNGLRRKKKKIMLVFISGGTSLLEVAAFRCLSADSSFPFSIVIASTSIMNGNALLKSLYSGWFNRNVLVLRVSRISLPYTIYCILV